MGTVVIYFAARLDRAVFFDTPLFYLNGTEQADRFAKGSKTFQADFNRANKERHRQLTASTAGYHGAHQATSTITPVSTPTRSSAAAVSTPTPPATTPPNYRVQVEGDRKMYYCWTHGLGSGAGHTSATCERKADGHQDDATVFDPKGGSNRISLSSHRRPSNNRQSRN